MLKGKTIIVGVTGGIAAYKACEIVSTLKKLEADVWVAVTKEASKLVGSLSFRTLSGNPVIADLFDSSLSKIKVPHIALSKKADLMIIAPATANILAKFAGGIADDALSTILLATRAPIIFAPAMNTQMWENPATIKNLETIKKRLKGRGEILGPVVGNLACDDVGKGKMVDPKTIVEASLEYLVAKRDLAGKKILITAGGTQEDLDPVRFIGNRSSGKMGYALAKVARERGAAVTLVSANVKEKPPLDLTPVYVKSAQQLLAAVRANFKSCDALIMAAAVADWSPKQSSPRKLKTSTGKGSGKMSLKLELVPTPDILGSLNDLRTNQVMVGFALETENQIKNAKEKLKKKNLDLIVANSEKALSADESQVTLINKNGKTIRLPQLPKEQTAKKILDIVSRLLQKA